MIAIRSLMFAAWLYGGTLVGVIWGLRILRRGEQRVLLFAQSWARSMLGGLRILCGIRWEISGLEHLPDEGPALVASMHQSAFDTLIWSALSPRSVYVFKRELSSIPLFGRYLSAAGMIPVDREASGGALRGLLRASDRAIAANRCIIIFPQGTRMAPDSPIILLSGVAAIAARSGLPVIPVVTNSGRLWGRGAFLKRPGKIKIKILPPLPAGLPREVLMDRLASLFAAASSEFDTAVDNSVSEAQSHFARSPS